MGYGSFMSITNNTSNPVMSFVTASTCMYDGGQEGSNLSTFNNATIPGNGTLPSAGPQYIEVKNSGSCWFGSGSFTLDLQDASGSLLSTLAFSDKTASWVCSNSNPSTVNVDINNSGQQGTINITVE